MKDKDTGECVTKPNKELIEALKAMLKPKSLVEIYKVVEGTGVANNLTFSEAGLLKEVSSKKPKTERKRPEFTFEDGVYLGQDCGFHASYLIITMEHSDLYTTQQQIGAVQEYLKARALQSDYSFKPLRKKLKLYVKWLQSELSKQGE